MCVCTKMHLGAFFASSAQTPSREHHSNWPAPHLAPRLLRVGAVRSLSPILMRVRVGRGETNPWTPPRSSRQRSLVRRRLRISRRRAAPSPHMRASEGNASSCWQAWRTLPSPNATTAGFFEAQDKMWSLPRGSLELWQTSKFVAAIFFEIYVATFIRQKYFLRA
jgi:hypothetical protein